MTAPLSLFFVNDVNMSKAIDEMRREARAEGYAEGVFDLLHKLVDDGLISVEIAAERANVSIKEFLAAKKSAFDA